MPSSLQAFVISRCCETVWKTLSGCKVMDRFATFGFKLTAFSRTKLLVAGQLKQVME